MSAVSMKLLGAQGTSKQHYGQVTCQYYEGLQIFENNSKTMYPEKIYIITQI